MAKAAQGLLVAFILLLSTGVSMAQDSSLYHEAYRPQVHFSPPCRWMNDPNGLVYADGEYHLFYQYYPLDSVWGPMHWGHAVSPDLVHWQNLPIALYPDDIGAIWSGGAVYDAENTSGLVPGGGIVAIFSYQNQSQGLAYSTDSGRSWEKYAGNPVLPPLGQDSRDPKVFWHAEISRWVMILAVGGEAQIFTSPNLIDWEYASSFAAGHIVGVWEVPDLFPIEVDGVTKWIMLISVTSMAPGGGGGVQYFVGDFDGTTFTNDNPPGTVLWLDYGTDNYAGTTWENVPDGRRLYIGWMSDWQYAAATPTDPWRGQTTLPRELSLVNTEFGYRLRQTIPAAFEGLRTPLGTWDDLTVSGEFPLEGVTGRTLEVIAEIDAGDAARFGIDVQSGEDVRTRVIYNAAQGQLLVSRTEPQEYPLNGWTTAFGAPAALVEGTLRLHIYVDESSVEVLARDGLAVLTALTYVNSANNGLVLFADGTVTVKHLEIYALESIWTEEAVAGTQAIWDEVCLS